MINVVYLCIGGNIGNREQTISDSLVLLGKCIGEIKTSSTLYETDAWGVENQQAYLNQCICIHTPLNAENLIIRLLDIEQTLGRKRSASLQYEARTIDIDVLFFNDAIINTKKLIVPHPRLHLRRFVLQPLHEIAENYTHPILRKTVHYLLTHCTDNLSVVAKHTVTTH